MDVIVTNFKYLRALEMVFPDRNTTHFFSSVGPKLEHLGRLGIPSSPEFIRQLKEHCPILKSLKVGLIEPKLKRPIVDLMLSLPQLQHLMLEPILALAEYKKIAQNCPGLQCYVSCSWYEAADVMNGLGDLFVRISIHGEDVANLTALSNAVEYCPNLSEIEWISDDFEGIKSLKCVLPNGKSVMTSLKVKLR